MIRRSVGFECVRDWNSFVQNGQNCIQHRIYLLMSGELLFTSRSAEYSLIRGRLCGPGGRAAQIRVIADNTTGHIIRFRRSALSPHLVADDEILQYYELCDDMPAIIRPYCHQC